MKLKLNRLDLKFIMQIMIIIVLTLSILHSFAREVVDMAGRKVNVPENVTKIACMQGPTYEMVFAFGGKDKISLVRNDHKSAYPLALLTNPGLKNIKALTNIGPRSPVNIEEFIRIAPDLVIYWNIPQELAKFDEAGIAAIVVNWSATVPKSVYEANDKQKRKFRFLAEILGEKSMTRYKKWKEYLDNTTAFIESRVKGLNDSDRPVVYMGNSWGTNILSTWGGTSTHNFTIELCGGKSVGFKGKGMFPEITKEQLLGWSPGIIVVDNHGRYPEKVIEELNTNPDYAPIPAVKNGRLYRIPSGVFFLDKGTSAPVFMRWLAKQLHPDLFKDVDMVNELKFYFKEFYEYELTTREAEKALAGWVESEAYEK